MKTSIFLMIGLFFLCLFLMFKITICCNVNGVEEKLSAIDVIHILNQEEAEKKHSNDDKREKH